MLITLSGIDLVLLARVTRISKCRCHYDLTYYAEDDYTEITIGCNTKITMCSYMENYDEIDEVMYDPFTRNYRNIFYRRVDTPEWRELKIIVVEENTNRTIYCQTYNEYNDEYNLIVIKRVTDDMYISNDNLFLKIDGRSYMATYHGHLLIIYPVRYESYTSTYRIVDGNVTHIGGIRREEIEQRLATL